MRRKNRTLSIKIEDLRKLSFGTRFKIMQDRVKERGKNKK